jgi:Flp pilus assembly protein TadD
MPRTLIAALVALTLPTAALAVSTDSSEPPAPTPTADCPTGQIWNPSTRRCEEAEKGRHDDSMLYEAVRELAYIGRYESAEIVLSAMSDPLDDRVLTYRGFLARMQGEDEAAIAWYLAALQVNPDNLLARSYMGMGLVAAGDMDGARMQLAEIRARGGGGSWAERALVEALASGRVSRY